MTTPYLELTWEQQIVELSENSMKCHTDSGQILKTQQTNQSRTNLPPWPTMSPSPPATFKDVFSNNSICGPKQSVDFQDSAEYWVPTDW